MHSQKFRKQRARKYRVGLIHWEVKFLPNYRCLDVIYGALNSKKEYFKNTPRMYLEYAVKS